MSRVGRAKRQASEFSAKVKMTEAQVAACKAKLMKDNRVNCYPNSYDINNPIRVSFNVLDVETGTRGYKTFGYFTNAHVASYIGEGIGEYFLGPDKFIGGDWDEALVFKHPEYQRWLEDERNAPIVTKIFAGWQKDVDGVEVPADTGDDMPF